MRAIITLPSDGVGGCLLFMSVVVSEGILSRRSAIAAGGGERLSLLSGEAAAKMPMWMWSKVGREG